MLSQCAAALERTLERYAARSGLDFDNDLVRDVVSAAAAVATAVRYLDAERPQRELALRLTIDVCRATAESCRSYGFEHDVLLCAASCERAAAQAELALSSPAA